MMIVVVLSTLSHYLTQFMETWCSYFHLTLPEEQTPPQRQSRWRGAAPAPGSNDTENTRAQQRPGRRSAPEGRSPPAPGGGRWGAARPCAPASLSRGSSEQVNTDGLTSQFTRGEECQPAGSHRGQHLETPSQPLMARGQWAQEAGHQQQEATVEALPGGGEAVALPDDANLGYNHLLIVCHDHNLAIHTLMISMMMANMPLIIWIPANTRDLSLRHRDLENIMSLTVTMQWWCSYEGFVKVS